MSRASRRAQKNGALNASIAPPPNISGGASSIFAGANFSTRRGYIYVPTIETKREIDSYSQDELIKRARWLKRNTGFTRRCINGIANMVGYLSPRALTKDCEWNKLAEAAFEARAGSALTFDKTARFNVYNYQPLVTRTRLGDGDMLSVFTESDTGSGGAMVMSYEGHQIRSPFGDTQDQRRAGVRSNPLGRPLAYSVMADYTTNEAVEIPVSDCVLNADYDSFGWGRGVTALHCAINHLLDETEIISDVKLGIKSSNRIGYWISTAAGQTVAVPGMRDRAKPAPGRQGSPSTDTATTGKGNEVMLEDAWRGGKILNAPPGQEIKQLLDERPHPNSMALLEWLNRDIAAGLEMSSDVLWNIAKLGGASVRYVLADAQVTIDRHQQILVDQFLTRFWIYFIAKEMKAGRLRKCQDPEWWKVGWQPPAKLTVDISRDGRLSIDLHRAGMLTAKRWYGMQGLDDEVEDRTHVEIYARRLVLCQEIEKEYASRGYKITIDPERVFPTGVPGITPPPGTILDPSGNVANDPAFNAAESFTYIEGRLDDIAARLAA